MRLLCELQVKCVRLTLAEALNHLLDRFEVETEYKLELLQALQ